MVKVGQFEPLWTWGNNGQEMVLNPVCSCQCSGSSCLAPRSIQVRKNQVYELRYILGAGYHACFRHCGSSGSWLVLVPTPKVLLSCGLPCLLSFRKVSRNAVIFEIIRLKWCLYFFFGPVSGSDQNMPTAIDVARHAVAGLVSAALNTWTLRNILR